MNNNPIQFPESYYSTLTQEEVQEVAIALGKKFEDHDKNYDSAFSDIRSITSRIVRDKIDKNKVSSLMQWQKIQNAASWTDDYNNFIAELANLAEERSVEASCSLALLENGTLIKSTTIKLGIMIRDLIDFNNIQGSEDS
jgi:hypothetical protein